ncbi:peptidyl-prolyl cis-trans isomerase [Phycisphaeraceae bacterium D3-23]
MPTRRRYRPTAASRRAVLAGALLAPLGLVGCETWPTPSQNHRVALEDFVGDQPRPGVAPTANTPAAEPTTTDTAEQASPGDPAERRALSVDAMVGHVNGEAIYAHAILEPIDARLAAFGRQYDGDEFLQRAAAVVAGRLKEVLIDKLILAEAGSGLSDRERQGVEGMVQQRREEMLRYYGQGSLTRARRAFLADEGIEFDEALAQFREEIVVRRYLQQELLPQINVQQRDVERLYTDLCENGTYDSKDQRVIRLIMTRDAVNAQTIEARLSDGDAFADVARDDSLNQYSAATGGQFNNGEPIEGDQVMGDEAVNAAILALEQGHYAGPIVSGDRHFFVQLESFEAGLKVELRDVQAELEQRLRLEQWDALFRGFRQELWDAGGYTDPVQMTENLLDIAIARYDSAG